MLSLCCHEWRMSYKWIILCIIIKQIDGDTVTELWISKKYIKNWEDKGFVAIIMLNKGK